MTGQATTQIYTLSLHDALPIYGNLGADDRRIVAVGPDRSANGSAGLRSERIHGRKQCNCESETSENRFGTAPDRKSTRLNSSHSQISYAVFCLKKKKNEVTTIQ